MKARQHSNVAIHHAAIQALEPRWLLAAQLVRDISPAAAVPSDPQNLVDVNGMLFFTADDVVHGRELWKSDGTVAGTVLVRDIFPGSGSSAPANLVNVHGWLFFTADDAGDNRELWKSDGTEAGTVLVKDIDPEINMNCDPPYGCYTTHYSSNPSNLTPANGTLFFTATNSSVGGFLGYELWKSDGTEVGTVVVKDINPGTHFDDNGFQYPNSSSPENLTAINGTLFFTANDGTHGRELLKSDGTHAGTVLVRDIFTAVESAELADLINVNGTLFFTADDGSRGRELWKSDGTEAGTIRVKDINPGPGSSGSSNLVNVNGTLLFTANDGSYGIELWKSDGTASGTTIVKDIQTGSGSQLEFTYPFDSYPENLTNVNGVLYFTAVDGNNFYGLHGRELWKSDGTETGTALVKDIRPGSEPDGSFYPASSDPDNLTEVNGTLFFTAGDSIDGVELWRSDGTTGGTVRVRDISPGRRGSDPGNLANVNGTLFFTADDGVHGRELWMTTTSPLANDGVLSLAGTDSADTITFSISGSDLQVLQNGQLRTFPLADVTRIEIQALAGDDVIDFSGIAIPTDLDAGAGNDMATAGGGNDTVSGGDGNDTVSGSDGHDRITGGEGNDFLSGDAQNDRIDGGPGADLLVGNGGNDRLRGEGGNDRVYGRAGRDRLSGGGGKDRLFGGAGGDFLSGQGGDDQLFGEGGNDRLSGGEGGRDTLHGNAGDDHLISNDGTIDELFGDGGDDTATADADDILSSIEAAA